MPAKPQPPEYGRSAFDCPTCNAFAHQRWLGTYVVEEDPLARARMPALHRRVSHGNPLEGLAAQQIMGSIDRMHQGFSFVAKDDKSTLEERAYGVNIAQCHRCGALSIWKNYQLIFPEYVGPHEPNPDMPEDVQSDYREAMSIVNHSPRGAAALLRLCVEKICINLGGKGKNINDDIQLLVDNGLSEKIQKALDVVRVVGNDAVHPGTMDLQDDRETAYRLFELVNIIVQSMITEPARIDLMYASLPPEKLKQIERRNQPKQIAPPKAKG